MANTIHPLSRRLAAVGALVRQGTKVADIGTDHAYLPVYLVGSGHNPCAVASDIGAGPLSKAEQTVREAHLQDRIQTVLADGLHGFAQYGVQDIVIAGMGGETAADILLSAPFICDPAVRLILQPMTKSHVLRRFLWENGFAILHDVLCEDDRIYEILCAVYDGKTRTATPAEYLVGKECLTSRDELSVRYLNRRAAVLRRVIEGKQSAGLPAAWEAQALREMEDAICAYGNCMKS